MLYDFLELMTTEHFEKVAKLNEQVREAMEAASQIDEKEQREFPVLVEARDLAAAVGHGKRQARQDAARWTKADRNRFANIDGMVGAEFLKVLRRYIENPVLLVM